MQVDVDAALYPTEDEFGDEMSLKKVHPRLHNTVEHVKFS